MKPSPKRIRSVLVIASAALVAALIGQLWWLNKESDDVQHDPSDTRISESPEKNEGRGDSGIARAAPGAMTNEEAEANQAIAPRNPDVEVATDQERSYSQRRSAIQNLGATLDTQSLAALVEFLQEEVSSDLSSAAEERAVRNDLMNILRNQEMPVEHLAEILAEVFVNDKQDVVVRDYAIQHLGAWFHRAPDEDQPLILDTLMLGLDERESSIAGTSLLALRQIDALNDRVPEGFLPGIAADLASDSDASQLTRITAVQVAANFQSTAIKNVVGSIALDFGQSYPLRLSAVAALQQIGGNEAEKILSEVKSWEDPYLQGAFR